MRCFGLAANFRSSWCSYSRSPLFQLLGDRHHSEWLAQEMAGLISTRYAEGGLRYLAETLCVIVTSLMPKQLAAPSTPCKILRPKMQEITRWQFITPHPKQMLHADALART